MEKKSHPDDYLITDVKLKNTMAQAQEEVWLWTMVKLKITSMDLWNA